MKAFKVRHIHFVGIGGIGMSGMAELLLNQGYTVSGSDRQLTEVTDRLAQLGATIYEGHQAEHVENADVVVYSSAVTPDNIEVKTAKEKNIPVIKRAEMLAELMRMKHGIAIAGTHGKTTTTSLTGLVLTEGGFEPTLIIGGIVRAFASNAILGKSEFMVVEADEYDQSFLRLNPTVAVITNVEPEHLECYNDSYEELKEAFISFANKIPFYGAVLVCLDEPGVQEIIPHLKWNVITYGFVPQADLVISDFQQKGFETTFRLTYLGEDMGRFQLHVPGIHNAKNAAAAVGVGLFMNIPVAKIKKALTRFTGVYRRFELKAQKNGITIVDDYAHHPSEIQATLGAARNLQGKGRIIAIFQPHLFSRTQRFMDDFSRAFYQADELVVTDIYPAREQPIPGVHSSVLVEEIQKKGHKSCRYISDFKEIATHIRSIWKPGDLIITLGAGSINRLSGELARILEEEESHG